MINTVLGIFEAELDDNGGYCITFSPSRPITEQESAFLCRVQGHSMCDCNLFGSKKEAYADFMRSLKAIAGARKAKRFIIDAPQLELAL